MDQVVSATTGGDGDGDLPVPVHTQLYIPPFFVNELRVWPDNSLVLAMEGGLSFAVNPNIRFTYAPNGAKRFRVEAEDTEGHVFQNEWKVDGSGI